MPTGDKRAIGMSGPEKQQSDSGRVGPPVKYMQACRIEGQDQEGSHVPLR